MKLTRRCLLTALMALALALSACAPLAAAPAEESPATLAPSSTPLPSDTPAPSATPLPTDTPVPTATSTPDLTATYAAKGTAEMEKQIDRIAPDLDDLGFKTDSGRLAWVAGQPIEMSVSAYLEKKHEQITKEALADFILVTDVRWNSSSGLAGCSLIFRSADDLEDGEQYVMPILRLQNAPAWDIEYYKYGDWQATLTRAASSSARRSKTGRAIPTG